MGSLQSRRVPRIGNRVAPEIEQKLLEHSLEYPTHGQVRAANELKRHGIQISAGGVRSVWLRHNLQTKPLRLKRLERWAAENMGILTESQVQALETAKEEEEAHGEIESHHPGYLLAQDTCYMGYIKGIGRLYQQTSIDTYSNIGFAKIYLEKTSLTAADFMNDRVLPFFDKEGVQVLRVLTDRGTEYCGRAETHPYELYLDLNDIEHTRTKPRSPKTNGAVERLNQTIKTEFYEVSFRKKLYRTLEEIQSDLDSFMDYYNRERTNQGRYCQGRTPYETFIDGLDLYQQYVFENPVVGEEVMQ